MTTLVVTSSWPRTRDEIAGTFVRCDALLRGAVLAAVPRGPGVARGGPNVTVHELPHAGLFGTPGAARRLLTEPYRAIGVIPFARAVAELPRAARAVAHWLVPSGAIVRALYDDPELIAHGGDVRLLERLPRAVAAPFLRFLGRVRAVSEDLRRRLHMIEPSLRIDVEPMPIVFDRARVLRRGASLRARFGPRLQVVAARMVASKRIERAIAHARGGRLALIGDGPARDRLLALARRSAVEVISPGAVPHEEALAWIAAADVVLAPIARGEGAPTVIREAEALGIPTVVFR